MQQTISEESYLTILTSTLLLLFFGCLLVVYFFRHQKKRFQHQQEVLQLQESFNQTILQAKLEIQEQTLDHIAKELHANFSHLVSLININLSAALAATEAETKKHVVESKQLAKQLMADIKTLSVSLNSDHIMKKGFYKALVTEMNRMEKTGRFAVSLTQTGELYKLSPDKEIILFRLSQEVLNNILSHSDAKTIHTSVHYDKDSLSLIISDDGKGFDPELAKERSLEKASTGLMNIARRASLIQASLSIESSANNGTTVKVIVPVTNK